MDKSNRPGEVKIKPVLRWAGGKSHIIRELSRLVPRVWSRYLDPMLGGGALFFRLRPSRSILGDINADLINFYKNLRDRPEGLIRRLLRQKSSSQRYYKIRSQEPRTPMHRAARFGYLNRLCWNGLYRVNRHGEFNVPIGSRLPKSLWDRCLLLEASASLQTAELLAGDFEEILKYVRAGDFIFLDPPYPRGASSGNGFDRYSNVKFSLHDHKRLSDAVLSLNERRVKIMLMLADDHRLISLYPDFLQIHRVYSKSLISGTTSGRKIVTELVLLNYSENKIVR